MKDTIAKFKHIIVALTWIIVLVSFLFLLGLSSRVQGNVVCKAIEIVIDYEKGNYFVNKEDVQKLITSQMAGNTFQLPTKQINLQKLEHFLEENPYIRNAEVYLDIRGKMWVEVKQHEPLVRIVSESNVSYYVSRSGIKMPTSSDFSARVPIASGYIADNGKNLGNIETDVVQDIYSLMEYIKDDKLLQSLFEQIYIEENGDFILTPKIGNHEINLGSVENKKQKIAKLLVFYKEGLANVGWDKYRTINLKYKNQIVCTKK
ncbi:MAG: cell division protein FtsQ/DivIB [Chitinophagales bacterium]